MDLIIRGGTIVTAADTFVADIGIAGGKVVQIGGDFAASDDVAVIDAHDRLVLPGAIDVHTHLDAPSQGAYTSDDFLTGTIAAACGGTTTIVDFCAQQRGQSLLAALDDWHAKARDKAVVDYGFHMMIVDLAATTQDELARLPEMGVTSFKLFMAYKGQSMVNDDVLLEVLDQARLHGALVLVHAENGEAAEFLRQRLLNEGKTDPKYHATSRPPRVEAEATARAIALAEIVGAPIYIVHVSCAEALEEVVRGRARGVDVLAETCPQYLYLTEDVLDQPGFEGAKYVFTPPARQPHQPPALVGRARRRTCSRSSHLTTRRSISSAARIAVVATLRRSRTAARASKSGPCWSFRASTTVDCRSIDSLISSQPHRRKSLASTRTRERLLLVVTPISPSGIPTAK